MFSISKIVNFFIGLSQKTGGFVYGEKKIDSQISELSRMLAAEGTVLLKNEKNTLPLNGETAFFGRVQNDYFYVGYGSGGDVKTPYKVSLMQGVKNNGKIKYNEKLAKVYEEWCNANKPDEGFWGHWPLCFKEMPIDDSIVKDAAKTSSTAVVIIGRAAGEDREQKLVKGGFYLNDDEIGLLNKVTTAFEKTVVIINSGNVIDFGWLNSYGDRISAVLLAWQGGMESGNALADVLSGKINPCGRLPDTIADRYEDYPTYGNFGKKKYNDYVEDIYVGYRYFETFAKDKVLFPFGSGLSYTEFSHDYKFDFNGSDIKIAVDVNNIGKYSGKDVVQFYFEAPQGKLGKPSKSLVGFIKTDIIPAMGNYNCSFHFVLDDLYSYDDNNSVFILEKGEYRIFAGENVRECDDIGGFILDKDIIKDGEEICPPEKPFKIMYPIEKDGRYTVGYKDVATRKVSLKDRILKNLPEPIVAKGINKISFADVKNGKNTIKEFIAQLSDIELETLTRGDLTMNSKLGALGNGGALGGISEALRSKGVPPAILTDGPSGIRLMFYASLLPCGTAIASALNEGLTEELFSYIGKEMAEKGSDVLLAPGMNIHRDPLCGRNFEYFSEDPIISGKSAAAIVKGIQKSGVGACPKHFACNSQETNRAKTDARVSQRALREIYLKGFEICVKEAKPLTMMTSYNRVNGIYSCNNYDFCTVVLRKEWGYKGLVMTDWWTRLENDKEFSGVLGNAYRIRAQADVLMPGGKRLNGKYDYNAIKSFKSGFTRAELQRSAENVLNFLLNCEKIAEKVN